MTEAAITRQPGQAATHTIQQEVLPVAIERTVEHTTETIRGKTYPLTTIRENGYQIYTLNGKEVPVVSVTICESPLGRSVCVTEAGPGTTPERIAAKRKRLQEVAARELRRQGLY